MQRALAQESYPKISQAGLSGLGVLKPSRDLLQEGEASSKEQPF